MVGHGYWHLLTAMGAYTFMALVEFLTMAEGSPDVGFAWPAKATLEKLIPSTTENGHVKSS